MSPFRCSGVFRTTLWFEMKHQSVVDGHMNWVLPVVVIEMILPDLEAIPALCIGSATLSFGNVPKPSIGITPMLKNAMGSCL